MARCYFPGCENHANTKEHIPPKSFFPDSKKTNLMTVKSCKTHNNEKTKDDIYALANICVNCITNDKGDALEVFESSVKPQLMHNNESLFKKIFKDLSKKNNGYKFQVDSERLNSFFECLTHGVLFKKTNKKINLDHYRMNHLYMNLEERREDGGAHDGLAFMKNYWRNYLLGDSPVAEILEFKSQNKSGYSHDIYKVKIIGADFLKLSESADYSSSISVIHEFYGHFTVVSALTRVASFENTPIYLKPQTIQQ